MLAFNVAATVTHCSDRKASRFWIMLWPVFGPADHGIMEGSLHRRARVPLMRACFLSCFCHGR
jgi:hypothetical protein